MEENICSITNEEPLTPAAARRESQKVSPKQIKDNQVQ